VEFANRQSKFYKSYQEGNTDAFDKRTLYNKEFFARHKYEINNWQGIITKKENGGYVISLKIKEFELFFQPEYGKENKELVANLQSNQSVLFSARVIPNEKKGIRETSITESGSMVKPEYMVSFSSIQINPYPKMLDEVIALLEKKSKAEAKAKAERLAAEKKENPIPFFKQSLKKIISLDEKLIDVNLVGNELTISYLADLGNFMYFEKKCKIRRLPKNSLGENMLQIRQ